MEPTTTERRRGSSPRGTASGQKSRGLLPWNKGLWWLVLILVFCAAFLIGMGAMQSLQSIRGNGEIPNVLTSGDGGQALEEGLSNVSAAAEMYADTQGVCAVRIQNWVENRFSVRATLVRSATGEVLYQSGLMDPGSYVEYVQLDIQLSEGWYPCRVVWEFYQPDTQEPVGKAAQSAVVIIQE